MASRWRQWSYDTHVNISSKSNIAMVQPVNHSVGRGRLHLLAEKVSMPQLDMPARSPGSSKVRPPTRGMGRADLLRSRLQRNNEARLPGVKSPGVNITPSPTPSQQQFDDKTQDCDVIIKKLPPTVTKKDVYSLLESYGSAMLQCTLAKEADGVTAYVRMENTSVSEWIVSSLHGAEVYGNNIECIHGGHA